MITFDPVNCKNLKILFLGTPGFAAASLKRLVEDGYDVAAVVTAPDKPAGRGLKIHRSEVKEYAESVGLRVLQPEKLRDPAFLDHLRELNLDLGIVIAFRMLPEAVWSMPRLGTFNLHASLLPQYRGAAPINHAIMNGETLTGLTTFFLDAEIDKGDIIGRVEMPILPCDTAGTLHDRLMEAGTTLVTETVDRIAAGNVVPYQQRGIPAETLRGAPKIFRDDCRVDWNRPGAEIGNFIRGLSPHPAAWSALRENGTEAGTLKIYDGAFVPETHGRTPGTVDISDRKNFRVACAGGWFAITDLQPSGKRRMTAAEMINGLDRAKDYSLG